MKKILILILLMITMMVFAGCEKSPSPTAPAPSTEPASSAVFASLSSSDCVGVNYQQIYKEFDAAGFLNVDTEVIRDLISAETNRAGMVESVSINGMDFAQGEEFTAESSVIIRYHDYRLCTVSVHVDFIANWVFNKYDVGVLVDDLEKRIIEHGTDEDFEFVVKAGTHTLSFVNDEDDSVKGTTTISVDGDTNIEYQISCYRDEIKVQTIDTEILECTTSEHAWRDVTCVMPRTCAACGKTEGDSLGHVWEEATCTSPKTCSVCEETEGDPAGHNVSAWTILTEATCGTVGAKTGNCSVCAKSIEEDIPQTGAHKYGEWVVVTQPSCTSEGKKERICGVCQHADGVSIEVLSHDYVESIVTEATHYQEGTKGKKCSVCGTIGETVAYYSYYETSLKDVFNAYRANEISASEKFKSGLYIEFTAKISKIEKGGLLSRGDVVFEVSNGTLYKDEVKCKIKSSEQLEYVKTLSAGQKVTIKGKLDVLAYYEDLGSNMYVDIIEIK